MTVNRRHLRVVNPRSSRAVAYARVSASGSTQPNKFITAQLVAIRGYAHACAYELVEEYVDLGVTGIDDDRPAFTAMIERLLNAESNIGTLIVESSSRFMRNPNEAEFLTEKLRKAGISVVAVKRSYAVGEYSSLGSVQ